ncbi:MAG: Lon-like protease [Acidimicrobiaceae bacterium]|jgi:PDZ domain-containing protein
MTNVNNLDTIVDGPPDLPDYAQPSHPRRRWFRRWWWAVVIVTVVGSLGVTVLWSVTTYVPYVIESPGNLYTTGDRISIAGATPYPTVDKIDLVTVSLDTRVTRFEKFVADHNTDDVVIPAKEVLGNQTAAQNDELNALLMKQSKDEAVLVALQKLGYDVHPTQSGAVVEETVPGAPADGVIHVAETIVAIDGTPVVSADDLHTKLAGYKPAAKVTITLEAASDRAQRTVEVTLGDNPKSPGVAFIGVGPSDRLDYPDLPVKVTVNSGSIGGPSAGLAFTLGILDLMTPGDLTAGKEVAATGTISVDGTIGPIGGIEGKVTTVARAQVKYFLVPVEDAEAAQAHAPKDVQIVPVHTLDDALNFLATIGGSGLPPVSVPAGS